MQLLYYLKTFEMRAQLRKQPLNLNKHEKIFTMLLMGSGVISYP
jgi:hypothetical protein